MTWAGVCKIFQKQSFDLLSRKNGIFIILAFIFFLVLVILQFWESLLSSLLNDLSNSRIFSNNIGGKTYFEDSPITIDVVYTWVNGSDPKLLHDLTLFKFNLLQKENIESKLELKCSYDDCLKSNSIAIFPAFTDIVTLDMLRDKHSSLKNAVNFYDIYSSLTKSKVSIIEFNNTDDFNSSVYSNIIINDVAAKIYPIYYISDSSVDGSILADDLIILIGLPSSILKASLILKLREYSIKLIQLDLDSGQAVLRSNNKSHSSLLIKNEIIFYVNFGDGIITVDLKANDIDFDKTKIPENGESDKLKNKNNFNLPRDKNKLNKPDHPVESLFKSELNKIKDTKRRKLVFKQAYYIWRIKQDVSSDNAASSRFEDHDELKYSLRSLEKYAPWVRQIFIITNGQIPSWLNTNNKRVVIVTHKEIFPNISHLPTFSSPAIECHLHRIPNLAKHYIYFNDDVFIGQKISIDDFYTTSNGQKLYPTWVVPDCQSGCPNSWLNDGYCDRACNNSNCNWDEGDCNLNLTASNHNGNRAYVGRNYWLQNEDNIVCNAGCMDNWVADKYCDRACNVRSCAFDAGDCGVHMFYQLQEFKMGLNISVYNVINYHIFYLNYSNINIDFEDGFYEDSHSHVIRSISLAQSFKVLIIVLFVNQTSETLISLTYKHKNLQLYYNFTLLINTFGDEANLSRSNSIDELDDSNNLVANTSAISTNNILFLYSRNVKKYPVALNEYNDNTSLFKLPFIYNDTFTNNNNGLVNYILDIVLNELGVKEAYQYLKQTINLYIKKFSDGDLTPRGLEIRISELIRLEKNNIKRMSQNRIIHKEVLNNKKLTDDFNMMNSFNNSPKFGRKLLSFDMPNKLKTIKNINLKLRYVKRLTFPLLGGKKSFRHLTRIFQSKGFLPWEIELDNEVIDEIKDDNSNTLLNNYKLNKKVNRINIIKEKIAMDLFKSSSNLHNYKSAYHVKNQVSWKSRKLLDLFGGSLRYVGKIYDKEYGKSKAQRKVPAHMAHYFDKDIVTNMQNRFTKEWDVTSSHKFRQIDDMQLAFSYFYFVVNEKKNLIIDEIFAELDADNSNTLSDREIRTLATRLFDLPLSLEDIDLLEGEIISCSKNSNLSNQSSSGSVDVQVRLDSKDLFVEEEIDDMNLDYIFGKLIKKKKVPTATLR